MYCKKSVNAVESQYKGQKICPKCGETLDENLNFCWNCGCIFENALHKCAECCAVLPDNTAICPICGTPVEFVESY